jgi:hypothetical protein
VASAGRQERMRQRRAAMEPLVHFWFSDASLTALLVLLVLIIFVFYPMHSGGVLGVVVVDFTFSLIIVTGVIAVAGRRLATTLAGALAALTLLLHWSHFAGATGPIAIISALSSMLMLSLLAALVLVQTFREGPITYHRIQGAIVVYILIGMIFAFAYRLVLFANPAAFNEPFHGQDEHILVTGRLVYFSFITLTTLGYGDVTPVSPAARSIAMLEGLTGQLFPTILIARLVALEIIHRQQQREGAARSAREEGS